MGEAVDPRMDAAACKCAHRLALSGGIRRVGGANLDITEYSLDGGTQVDLASLWCSNGQLRKPSRSRPTNQSAKVSGLALVAM